MINTTDLTLVIDEQVEGKLLTNAKQIRDFVTERVKDYSPDQYVGRVAEAKSDRAALNARRLELEREFMQPFSEFKQVIAETVQEIKDASARIGVVSHGICKPCSAIERARYKLRKATRSLTGDISASGSRKSRSVVLNAREGRSEVVSQTIGNAEHRTVAGATAMADTTGGGLSGAHRGS